MSVYELCSSLPIGVYDATPQWQNNRSVYMRSRVSIYRIVLRRENPPDAMYHWKMDFIEENSAIPKMSQQYMFCVRLFDTVTNRKLAIDRAYNRHTTRLKI